MVSSSPLPKSLGGNHSKPQRLCHPKSSIQTPLASLSLPAEGLTIPNPIREPNILQAQSEQSVASMQNITVLKFQEF